MLAGKSITTIRTGGLGISLRSKSPILNDRGQVVGIVSVGYLARYLDAITFSNMINLLIVAATGAYRPVYFLLVFHLQY